MPEIETLESQQTSSLHGWRIEKDGDFWKITGHVNPNLLVPHDLAFLYETKEDVYHAIYKHRGELR